MECREVTNALVAYLDDALPPAERVSIRAHVTGCEACREELAALSALQRRIGQSLRAGAARVAPSPQAWDRLRVTLAGENHPSRPWLPAWGIDRIVGGIAMKKGLAITAAAALVIALGVGVMALVPSVRAGILRMVHSSAPAWVGRMSETPFPGSRPITEVNMETGEVRISYISEGHETTRQTVRWDEAQAAVTFTLRQPAYLPEGAELTRIELVTVPDADGQPQERRVEMWYIVGGGELMLEQCPPFSEILPPPPGVETVTINGALGWTVSDENTILSWMTDEARYHLNGYVSLEELLKIAESLS